MREFCTASFFCTAPPIAIPRKREINPASAPDPQYIQQAFATSEPFFVRQAGIETRVLLTRDAGYSPYRVMFTTRPAIAKLNPALNPEWMQSTWQKLRDGHFVAGDDPCGAQLGQMDPKRWATMYEQLTDLKVISNPFDPTTAYTLQFIQSKWRAFLTADGKCRSAFRSKCHSECDVFDAVVFCGVPPFSFAGR